MRIFDPVKSAFLDFLYPSGSGCIVCDSLHCEPFHSLCAKCLAELRPLEGPFCPRCGKPGWAFECPHCNDLQLGQIAQARAAFPYEGPAGALIRALKYKGIRAAVPYLADGLNRVFSSFDCSFDAMIPIPLHRLRLRERGFNQAQVLAEAIMITTGLPIWSPVIRTRYTSAQAKSSGTARRHNMADAFRATENLDGCSVLLVDDVLTTGSTAAACAAALMEAGASKVCLLCCARADLDPDDAGS